jgi:hypothetical protein
VPDRSDRLDLRCYASSARQSFATCVSMRMHSMHTSLSSLFLVVCVIAETVDRIVSRMMFDYCYDPRYNTSDAQRV